MGGSKIGMPAPCRCDSRRHGQIGVQTSPLYMDRSFRPFALRAACRCCPAPMPRVWRGGWPGAAARGRIAPMASIALPLPSRVRALTLKRPTANLAGVAVIVAFSLVAAWPLITGGTMIGQDTATFFYPMYRFLGEELRAFHLPVWNPYQFSGTPFLADPESGWMYLPAMLLFTVLPVSVAAPVFLFGHLLMAGLGTFGLARTLRMNLLGALVAATAYEFTGLLYGRSVCCPVYIEVVAWLPLVFLCMEKAIQSDDWLARACWWGASGLALSQIFAAWLGQGSYYVLLAIGGYIGYRTLLAPPPFATTGKARAINALTH